MANKSNSRYKQRKRINSIKHEPKSLFDKPAKLIKGWEDLVGLENDNYVLEIDVDRCNGQVRCKHEVPEDEWYDHNQYLSTHTFYGHNYFYSTSMLRRMGFNIQLKNWDGETVWCKY